MNSLETDAGMIVERGELIGTVGSTGYLTGPHLHFEMRIGEQPVSPLLLFEPEGGLYSLKLARE
jgi:murein DD-endopeptidase MepM/ murein hydrolase activator NlpD